MKRIIDDQPLIKSGYLKFVYFRSNRVENIKFLDWVKLWLYEFLFGVEILEQCQLTSTYNDGQNLKYGQFLHLSDFVPAGIITSLLRGQIYQLLFYKYYKHYSFLEHESTPDESAKEIDLRNTRFAFKHDQLFQIIAFRRVYILQWVVLNLSIDLLVWSISDIVTAFVAGVFIESIRRLIKL